MQFCDINLVEGNLELTKQCLRSYKH